jgi:Glycosyl hydrolases family 16
MIGVLAFSNAFQGIPPDCFAYRLPGGGSYDLGKFFQLGPADYHEYAIEWAPNSVKFFIDKVEYTNYGPADVYGGGRWVFNDQPFHIVVNLAVIGNVTAVFSQSLLITSESGPSKVLVPTFFKLTICLNKEV